MLIAMIGLGRMGENMKRRLQRFGHTVLGYDPKLPKLSSANSLASLVELMLETLEAGERPVFWVMVPAGKPTNDVIDALADLLPSGAIVINGGNVHYEDDLRYSKQLEVRDIVYVDAGVSGGVFGRRKGYALMVSGPRWAIEHLMPIFTALKPRHGGFVNAGEQPGNGHYAKMAHNAAEYGAMQAIAEAIAVMLASGRYTEDDVIAILESWQVGSIMAGFLLDRTVDAMKKHRGALDRVASEANASGEGEWFVAAALKLKVPVPAVTAALYARYESTLKDRMVPKIIALIRGEFGDHPVTMIGDEKK